MKPQLSSVPMEAYKFLSKAVAHKDVPVLQWKKESLGHIYDLCNLLKAGKHFELPPRQLNYTEEEDAPGGLLDQSAKMCEKGVRLPYPVTTLSRVINNEELLAIYWTLDTTLPNIKPEAVALAEEEYSDGFFFTVIARNMEDTLLPIGYILFVKFDDLCIGNVNEIGTPVILVWKAPLKPEYAQVPPSDWRRCAAVVRDLIELNVGLNAERMRVVVDHRLTGTRAKLSKHAKHKSFYEIHRLVIDPAAPVVVTSEYKGGTHASPRWHERRGYWRTMKKTGKVVWVRACEVGKKSDGMVYKDYEIKLGAST